MPLKQGLSTIKVIFRLNANGDISLCIVKDKILPFMYELKFFFFSIRKNQSKGPRV